MGKPGKFLLDLNPNYLRLPLPNINDRKYSRNKHLLKAEKIHPNKISMPKSIAIDQIGKKLFTGSQDGNVYCLDLKTDQIESIANFSGSNNGVGRPLGMRIFQNVLYFIEANSGLYSFDLDSKKLKHLLALNDTKFLDGKPSKFFDDLVIVEEPQSDDNDNVDIIIYITDVSRKFSIDMWCYTYLEPDSTGRILRYNTSTGSVVPIVENLCFPNGIEVTKNNDSLLICELTKRRILQYKLKGKDHGLISVLMDNLPGEPENIRKSCDKLEESYWIGLALTRDYNNKLSFLDDYSTEPNLRKLILRSCYLLGTIMNKIGYIFGNEILKNKGLNLKTGLALILDDFMNNPGMAIKINLESNVLYSFQIENDISVISEIQELSFSNDNDNDDKSNNRILYTTSSGGNLNRIILDQ